MPGNIAEPASSGTPTPNYTDPVTREWLPAYAITLHVFATVLVAVRVGLRSHRKAGGFGVDDGFLIPAWLLATGCVVLASYGSYAGYTDRHIWDIRLEKFWHIALNSWIGQLFFLLGTGFLKTSILLFHRRFVVGTFQKRWRFAVWGAIAFTAAYTFALILVLIFGCWPPEAYWKAYDFSWRKSYHCADTKSLNTLAGVLTVVSDCYAVVLPCLMCRKITIARRQKLALNLIFCAGFLVVGASAVRTYVMTMLGTDPDVTWLGFWAYFWSIMEFDLGLILTCAPAMRILFRRQLRDTTQNSNAEDRLSGTYEVNCTRPLSEQTMSPQSKGSTRDAWTKHTLSKIREEAVQRDSSSSLTALPVQPKRTWSPEEVEEMPLHVIETSRSSGRMGPRHPDDSPGGWV